MSGSDLNNNDARFESTRDGNASVKDAGGSIVSLGIEHYAECMELSQFAFQYKRTPEELEDGRATFLSEPADRWGVIIDHKLAAQATVLSLHTHIAGKPFAMGGVAGVATWPEYRRRGLVAKLLVHSLKEMKRKGQTLSFLHPFAFGFYRKFGWETYTEYKSYTLEAHQLPARESYAGTIKRISDYDTIRPVYEQYAAQYNGTLTRTELWWKQRIAQRKPGQIAVYYDRDETAQGYMIYEVKDSELTLHELVTLNEEARRAIWSFIAQHDSMVRRVKLTAPANDSLPYMLADPRIKQEIVPYFMARIVDVRSFLEAYPFEPGQATEQFVIRIDDEHAPWNAGTYLLRINEDGKATLVEEVGKNAAEGTGQATAQAIATDIGTLSSLMLGYRSAAELSSYKRIHGDRDAINRLHRRIPERPTQLLDFF